MQGTGTKARLLFVVILTGCAEKESTKLAEKAEGAEPQNPLVERFLEESGRLKELSKEAAGQYERCLEMTLNQCAAIGFSGVARERGEAALCAYIKDETLRNACERDAIRSVAFRDKDPEKCKGIREDSEKRRCVAEVAGAVALENDKPEICRTIEEAAPRAECEARVYETRALRSGDGSECAKIEDRARRSQCQSNVALQNAQRALDPSACNIIEEEGMRDMCRGQVIREIAMREGKPELCKGIKDVAQCKDAALSQLAMRAKDPEKCKAIGDEMKKGQCIMEAGSELLAKDPTFCAGITEPNVRRHCFSVGWSSVKDLNDCAVCGRIKDQTTRQECSDHCYYSKAARSGDQSACDQIGSADFAKMCREVSSHKASLPAPVP